MNDSAQNYIPNHRRSAWRRGLASLPFEVPPRLALALLVAAGLAVLGTAALGGAYATCAFQGCPDVSTLGAFQPDGAPVLLDRNGIQFAELRPAQRVMVELEDLPEYVAEAFVAVEDRRFYEHGGVDWVRVGGAAWNNLRAGGLDEGSSTITMQLARNVFDEQISGTDRTFRRKIMEARVSREIEDRFAKPEILELYLNHIFFGGGARGIDAAAEQYFGHPASELDLPRAALLAALPKAPTHYDPRRHPQAARERRDLVLTLMEDQGYLDAATARAAREAPLGVIRNGRAPVIDPPPAAYFVEHLRQELEAKFGDRLYRAPLRVVTTLDLTLQKAAEESLERQLRTIERGGLGRFGGPAYATDTEIPDGGTPYIQGAAIIMAADTGDVLAWVGGRDFRHSTFDRVSQGRRQLGSAFKPFVYAAALAEGHPPSEQISDRPVVVRLGPNAKDVWRPRNFEGQYGGDISLRQALVSSRNSATIRLAYAVGLEDVVAFARRLGIEVEGPIHPSMVLGTPEASPLELARAYTTFATLGTRTEPRYVTRIESPDGKVLWEAEVEQRRVLDPALAYLTTDLLRGVVDGGTGYGVRQAGYRGPAAGKTGTTNGENDAWFVGYTPEAVGVVWIGFDQPQSIASRGSGGRLSAPVWGRMMRPLAGSEGAKKGWRRPSGIAEARVDPASGLVLAPGCEPLGASAETEIFLAGYSPSATCPSWQPPWSSEPADRLADLGELEDIAPLEDEPYPGVAETVEGLEQRQGESVISIRPSARGTGREREAQDAAAGSPPLGAGERPAAGRRPPQAGPRPGEDGDPYVELPIPEGPPPEARRPAPDSDPRVTLPIPDDRPPGDAAPPPPRPRPRRLPPSERPAPPPPPPPR